MRDEVSRGSQLVRTRMSARIKKTYYKKTYDYRNLQFGNCQKEKWSFGGLFVSHITVDILICIT